MTKIYPETYGSLNLWMFLFNSTNPYFIHQLLKPLRPKNDRPPSLSSTPYTRIEPLAGHP